MSLRSIANSFFFNSARSSFCTCASPLSVSRFAHFGGMCRGIGVNEGEREVLKHALHLPHAEAVGDGGVDFKRLKRDAPALMLGHMPQGLHIMFAVGELHDKHADVARGRHEEPAERLCVALGAVILVCAELCHAVNDEEQFLPEFFFYFLARDTAIFNRVVEEPCGDSRRVHAVLGENLRSRRGMYEIRLARVTLLAFVRLFRTLVRLFYEGDVLGCRIRHLARNLL